MRCMYVCVWTDHHYTMTQCQGHRGDSHSWHHLLARWTVVTYVLALFLALTPPVKKFITFYGKQVHYQVSQ
jgi:hypothetical protein